MGDQVYRIWILTANHGAFTTNVISQLSLAVQLSPKKEV